MAMQNALGTAMGGKTRRTPRNLVKTAAVGDIDIAAE